MMSRIDARIIATIAFIAFGVSYFMRAGFTDTATFWDFTLPLLVQGIAMATFFLAMITILLASGGDILRFAATEPRSGFCAGSKRCCC
jgi:hypothetical protein